MATITRKERIQKRNTKIRKAFYQLQQKEPKWKHSAWIEEVAEQFFLAPKTIEAVVRGDGVYAVD